MQRNRVMQHRRVRGRRARLEGCAQAAVQHAHNSRAEVRMCVCVCVCVCERLSSHSLSTAWGDLGQLKGRSDATQQSDGQKSEGQRIEGQRSEARGSSAGSSAARTQQHQPSQGRNVCVWIVFFAHFL